MIEKNGCPPGQVIKNNKCVQPALFTFIVGGNEHIRETKYYPLKTDIVTIQNDAMKLVSLDKGGLPRREDVAGYKHLKVFYDVGTLNIRWGETAIDEINMKKGDK